MTRKEQILILILAIAQFANVLDFVIMLPMGPQLMRVFDINTHQFGLLVSSYNLAAAFMGLAGAFFLDRFDRKSALLFAFSGFTVGTLLCGIADSYPTLLALRFATGLFGGITSTIIYAIVGDTIPNERRARAMGMVSSSFSIASIAGIPLSMYLAEKFSYHTPFMFIGSVAAIGCALIIVFVSPLRGHLLQTGLVRENPLEKFRSILQSRNARLGLAMMTIIVFGHFSIVPFISPYMVANVGFRESDLALIYLFGGIVSLVSNPLAGWMSDKMGRKRVFMIFSLLLLIPYFILTHLEASAGLTGALIVTSIWFIFTGGRFVPASTMMTSAVKPEYRGGYMSLYSFTQHVSSGIAAYFAGLIVVKAASGRIIHYDWVGYVGIVCALLGMFFANRLQIEDTAIRKVSDADHPEDKPRKESELIQEILKEREDVRV